VTDHAPVDGTIDPELQRAIASLSPPGILIGHRLISPGDESALSVEESATITVRTLDGRRSSGAARIVARRLLADLGRPPCALPKVPSGAPLWPEGIVGSLAHDDRVAVAALGLRRTASAVGVDVEPAVMLPSDMLELIATPRDSFRNAQDPYGGRLLFTAKEAVYKAVQPLDDIFLEFHDIDVDLAGRKAVTRNGRALELRYCVSTHLLVLALA
jgi:4'-phosphopantetheinyl transferase EntD